MQLIAQRLDALIERYGGAKKERGIWYHGTSMKRLPSIMRKGLIPNPEKKGYGSQNTGSWHNPSMTSIGGVYVTRNMMSAMSAANSVKGMDASGGVILVLDLQPRSFIVDEDNVSDALQDVTRKGMVVNEFAIQQLFSIIHAKEKIYPPMAEFARDAKSDYIEQAKRRIFIGMKEKVHPRLEKRLDALLSDGWKIAVKRKAAYVGGGWSGGSWDSAYRSVVLGSDKEPRSLVTLPTPEKADAEREFAEYVDKVTRAVKLIARPILTKDSNYKVARLMSPVGFRGKNRIVGIVELVSTKEWLGVRVLKGKLPPDFKRAWKEGWGTFRLIDKDGNVVLKESRG